MRDNEEGIDLGEAFTEHFAAVFRFALLRLPGEEEAAEDIVQEVFAVAASDRAPFRGDSSLPTWLCAIARRKIADYYRATARRPRRFGSRELDSLPSEFGAPEMPILAEERAEKIRSCLARLPAEGRYALVMRHVDRLTQEEIARVLGKSIKATESILHRARAAFAAMYGEDGGE